MSHASSPRAKARWDFARAHIGSNTVEPGAASSDAGFRSYWRTHDDAGRSLIVMDSPPEKEDVRPWLDLHARLATAGVRVPSIVAKDIESGFLLLEDLGGPTLLQTINAENADHWFDQALVQWLQIQQINTIEDLPAYDEALIRRELALFPDWFLGTHLNVTLSPKEHQALTQTFDVLVDALLSQPYVLVHRDFMPRNLMPLDSGVAVLDFQDAVRGPLAYDVISCFKDAFLSWPQPRVDQWTQHWYNAARSVGTAVPSFEQFQRDLDLTGIQRHIKVLGIFARLKHRDNKPRYLSDAPRFIAYLVAILPRYPELQGLYDVLQTHVLTKIPALSLPE